MNLGQWNSYFMSSLKVRLTVILWTVLVIVLDSHKLCEVEKLLKLWFTLCSLIHLAPSPDFSSIFWIHLDLLNADGFVYSFAPLAEFN